MTLFLQHFIYLFYFSFNSFLAIAIIITQQICLESLHTATALQNAIQNVYSLERTKTILV